MPDTAAHNHGHTDPAFTTLLPYDSCLINALAKDLIKHHQDRLPNLANTVILLPDPACHADMRKAILKAASQLGYEGVLGLQISSLRQWLERIQTCNRKKIGNHERELILVEALRAYPQLPGARQPWLLAENLLKLFDDLNQQHVRLDMDEADFSRQLRKAYGLDITDDNTSLLHLDREAQLVHRLWHAWHEQLDAQQADDSLGIYHHKLQANMQDANDPHDYWLAGYTFLTPVEQAWFNAKATQAKAHLFIHSDSADSQASEHNHFLQQVYASDKEDFANRARQCGETFKQSPVQNRIRIVRAENEEQEACSVELQVRQWLNEGKNKLGIITRDRRLARRVRALLERAGISLQDSGGWALSTTSAAAALERWLECIEQEFDHVALLDLLKSPFVFHEHRDEDYLKTVYRFENDIVMHENIGSGMHRYTWALSSRKERLQEIWSSRVFTSVSELLSLLEQAAKPLQVFTRNKSNDPAEFIELLLESMKNIGMLAAMEADPAGQRVLHELENLRMAASQHSLPMRWSEMRSWIGRTLERFSFRPDTTDDRVSLVDLSQSQLMQFDAVILAGADSNHLPGQPAQQAFFNDPVRFSLGLPGRDELRQQQFHYFHCLINQVENVVITHHLTSHEGEAVLPSPWLEALNRFHHLAFGCQLEDNSIPTLLAGRHSGVITDSRAEHIDTDARPAPATPVQLLPDHISASSYQQIMDCPYKFFASRLLGLAASDEVSEVLSKAEYGERVHSCLEAFHSDIENRPGPFREKLHSGNRETAIKLLNDIADSYFAADVKDNFEHRGWLKRFTQIIPDYIDWQISHAADWIVEETEARINTARSGINLGLKGRLDRIDSNDLGLDIIDYKTGSIPTQTDVNQGEAVQLPFYAMLSNKPVHRVEYVSIDKDKVKGAASLEGDDLADMVDRNVSRIAAITEMLGQQQPLTAWGDEKSCCYCEMHGLCRHDNWLEEDGVP